MIERNEEKSRKWSSYLLCKQTFDVKYISWICQMISYIQLQIRTVFCWRWLWFTRCWDGGHFMYRSIGIGTCCSCIPWLNWQKIIYQIGLKCVLIWKTWSILTGVNLSENGSISNIFIAFSHCLESKLKHKRMGTLQFCLSGILGTHNNNREEEFRKSYEENLK